MATKVQVAIDCSNPAALSAFWAEALGYQLQDPPAGFATWPEALEAWGVPEEDWNSASAVVDPAGKGPRIYFQRVPEGKQAKNRLHLDLGVSAGPQAAEEERRAAIEPEVDRLTALGASKLREHTERGEYWVVLTDPEGNEFCVT